MYLGHRRFLPIKHILRKAGNHFKGEPDNRKKPGLRTGEYIFDMVKDLQVIFGKGPGGQSVPNDANGHAPMWKKKSIFWELEYWKALEVRNAIDVMHVTKNLCVNLLGFERDCPICTRSASSLCRNPLNSLEVAMWVKL